MESDRVGQPPYPPNQPPYGHPQQPYHDQQYPPQYQGQQYPPPPPGPRKIVTKQRGLSAGSHTLHLVLTILTCGLWGLFVWLPLWIFRMIVRRKQVTKYHY
ncbi:hypothetical protein ABZU32_36830 [Sphaerisporangium sp. NPDC005288]|uniref:hypothetical protein n=1 Tax=Sphaerisporangium sp. NPDC005288 TaxID=3155114 RepID=UPI0033AA7CB9